MSRYKTVFEVEAGTIHQALASLEYYVPNIPIVTITNGIWVCTGNSGTMAYDNLGDRQCISFVGGGGATNGGNICHSTATISLAAGKGMRMKFSYYDAAASTAAFAIGLSTVTTALSDAWKSGGTPPANSFAMVKRTGETAFSIRSVKASGAPYVVGCSETIANATWYDYEVLLKPDKTTAGLGTVQVWRQAGGASGYSLISGAHPQQIVAAVPDTVQMAMALQWQAGDTGTTNKGALGYFALEVEM